MRHAILATALFGLLAGGMAHATDQAQLQALLGRAVQAHGGAAALAKYPAATWKGVARLYKEGAPSTHTLMGARQRGDQGLLHVENEIDGKVVRFTRVLNGSKGWLKFNENVQEIPPAVLAEQQAHLQATWLATLVPLLTDRYTLGQAPVQQVNGQPAIGVRLSQPGRRDVTLYFDPTTFLLVKKEMAVQDGTATVLQESYFSNYRAIEGVQTAHKVEIRWNGQRHLEMELLEVTLRPQLPEGMFQKP